MTQQGKPGWYNDGTGQQRWWDGRGWTGYTQAIPETPVADAQTEPLIAPAAAVAAAPEPVASAITPRRRGLSRIATAGLGLGALVLGMVFGGVIGSSASDHAPEMANLTASVSDLRTKLRSATSQRDSLKAAAAAVATQADQLKSRKIALDAEATQLAKRSQQLDAESTKLAARETTVKNEEAANAAAVDSSSNSSDTTSDSSAGSTSGDSSSSSAPDGATAQCNDGTYSYSLHHSGTCSHHGGVANWL